MLMINALVSWNVMVNILPSLFLSLSLSLLAPSPSFSPSLFFSLSVSQHGHSDGSLPAVSPEHLRRHSFPPTDVDCWDGWHHAVPPDRPHVLLVCQYTHTHAHILYTHTQAHTHAHTVTLGWSRQTMWASFHCQTSQSNPHGCMSISNYCAQKKMSLWLVFSTQYEPVSKLLHIKYWAVIEFQATHGKCLGVRCLRWKLCSISNAHNLPWRLHVGLLN